MIHIELVDLVEILECQLYSLRNRGGRILKVMDTHVQEQLAVP